MCWTGGELFAKRRKKADKWVVDEKSLGSNPSQFADQLLNQQQFGFQEEVDSQVIQEQQETFHQQQLEKQQQSIAMRQQRGM